MKKSILYMCVAMLTVLSLFSISNYARCYALSADNHIMHIAEVSKSMPTESGKSEICAVCNEKSDIPYFCINHIIIGILLAAALLLNFFKINRLVKMISNSVAVLLLIIVFSSQYTSKMFTQAKICLAILAVYLVFWIISVIKTVGQTEPKVSKRRVPKN